jgi:hypothetical protein
MPLLWKMGNNTENKGQSKTPTYLSWNSMRRRCLLGEREEGHSYSGISFCESWKIYGNFVKDMGIRPEGMTLDRIDTNANYCPENCRWATPTVQQRNRRDNRTLTYKGVTKTLHDWSEEVGVEAITIHKRLTEYGWSPEAALLTKPFGNQKERCKNNGKQKDYECPSCGKLMNKGNIIQHLRSPKNTCFGEPIKLS